jgi:hypothetical protein
MSSHTHKWFYVRDVSHSLNWTFSNSTSLTSSKAVAEGAIIWSICSNVSGRAPRSSFGIETTARFNPASPGHLGRSIITCASGIEKVAGRWSQIAAKVCRTFCYFTVSDRLLGGRPWCWYMLSRILLSSIFITKSGIEELRSHSALLLQGRRARMGKVPTRCIAHSLYSRLNIDIYWQEHCLTGLRNPALSPPIWQVLAVR